MPEYPKKPYELPLSVIYAITGFVCVGSALTAAMIYKFTGLYSMLILYSFCSLFAAVMLMVVTLLGSLSAVAVFTSVLFFIPALLLGSVEAGIVSALIPAAGGLAVGLLLKYGTEFNSLIARGCVAVFGVWAAGGALIFYRRMGSGFIEAAPSLILSKYMQVINYLQSYMMNRLYPEGSAQSAQLAALFNTLTSPDAGINGYILLVYALLYICFVIMAGIFVLSLIGKKLTVFTENPVNYPPVGEITVSRIGGILFLICSVISLFFMKADETAAFTMTAWFIYNLLLPVFFVSGTACISRVMNSAGMSKGKRRAFLSAGGAILVISGFGSLVSFIGAWNSIFKIEVSAAGRR